MVGGGVGVGVGGGGGGGTETLETFFRSSQKNVGYCITRCSEVVKIVGSNPFCIITE